jgi:hypothetical protein
LHFDAPVAILTIRFVGLLPVPHNCNHKRQGLALAQIIRSDGSCIGQARVPLGVFSREDAVVDEERRAEFVHLSTYNLAINPKTKQSIFCKDNDVRDVDQNGWHAPGCKYASNVHLMVIEWNKERKIAYRVGLARVQTSE